MTSPTPIAHRCRGVSARFSSEGFAVRSDTVSRDSLNRHASRLLQGLRAGPRDTLLFKQEETGWLSSFHAGGPAAVIAICFAIGSAGLVTRAMAENTQIDLEYE